MFLAELTCSDEDCELTVEVAGDLAALELLVCDDCGCCLQILALSAWEPAEREARLELPQAA